MYKMNLTKIVTLCQRPFLINFKYFKVIKIFFSMNYDLSEFSLNFSKTSKKLLTNWKFVFSFKWLKCAEKYEKKVKT